jgi:SNF2 family DNA or RNA helicase
MPLKNTEYYIFNFEQLDNAIELGKSLKARGIRYFVIVDESHNFADWRSARTQKLITLQTIRDDIYFVWASGSPVLKSAAELTSFLKCSDPRFSAQAERQFRKIYAASPGRANEIFNHRLGIMMAFLVPKSVVSKTKPKIVERPIKLPPSIAHKFLMSSVRIEMKEFIVERLKFYDGQMKTLRVTVNTWLDYHETKLTTRGERKAFEQYIKDIKVISKNPDLMITEVMTRARTYERTKLLPSLPPTERKKFKSALSAIKNIKLKVRGEALGTILSKRRSECAEALALHCKPEEIMTESLSKTLFFASSVLPIQSLTDHLRKIGFNPLMVYGGTNSQLVSMMNAFDEDPNINPVCATMQSLSEAVPVTAASTVVLLNRPYRQATWDQVIARADRLGNPHPVTVIETTLDTGNEPNVSSTTDAILSNVREMISDLIGSEFGGPDPEEREYRSLIDVSEVDPTVEDIDSLMV